MPTVFLDYASKDATHYIEIWRAEAKNFFTRAEIQVRDAILPQNAKTSSLLAATKSSEGNVLHSPQGSYSINMIKQPPPSSSSAGAIPPPSTASDPITQFGIDVIEPAFEKLSQALGKDAEDFLRLITDMSMDNLRTLVADAINGL